MKDVWTEVMPFELDNSNSHPCCMPLIVTGGYSAAYFSFLWSEIVAADVYAAFDEIAEDRGKFAALGNR